MGESANKFSLLSWPGKVADNPKPYGLLTKGTDPLTEQDLAEFEQKLLRLVHEMSEKISKESVDPNEGKSKG